MGSLTNIQICIIVSMSVNVVMVFVLAWLHSRKQIETVQNESWRDLYFRQEKVLEKCLIDYKNVVSLLKRRREDSAKSIVIYDQEKLPSVFISSTGIEVYWVLGISIHQEKLHPEDSSIKIYYSEDDESFETGFWIQDIHQIFKLNLHPRIISYVMMKWIEYRY